LQHKCTQHRPFTCFYWHFSNQRRRRPVRKRDGTFTYSADQYCSKYDETTGVCPNGDDCPYIHRNTGDTERRYHLRYYKTGTCIHETDSRGNCVKNGPHCAFAHGSEDLRPPVYDMREQGHEQLTNGDMSRSDIVNLQEKIVNEDPKWLDPNFVLANYKTEVCKRPPRLCRQGYACPQYHNPKDRRRNPKKFKYRSTPCPNVKQGDDWKDPSCCEKGDGCQFCHTRTEQQFHPEIYKSTKCHDMSQSGYCPRGAFCAFAHVEQEIRVCDDEFGGSGENDIKISAQDDVDKGFGKYSNNLITSTNNLMLQDKNDGNWPPKQQDVFNMAGDRQQMFNNYSPAAGGQGGNHGNQHQRQIFKPQDFTNIKNHELSFSAPKAIGSERYAGDNNSMVGSFGNAGSSWSRNALMEPPNFQDNKGFPDPFFTPKSSSGGNGAFVSSIVEHALDDPIKSIENIWNNEPAKSKESQFAKSMPLNVPPYQQMPGNNRYHHGGNNHGEYAGGEIPAGGSASNLFPMPSSSSVAHLGGGRNNHQQQNNHNQNMKNGRQNRNMNAYKVSREECEILQEKCRQWNNSFQQARKAVDAWRNQAQKNDELKREAERREHMLREQLRRVKTEGGGDHSNRESPEDEKERVLEFIRRQQGLLHQGRVPFEEMRMFLEVYKANCDIIEKSLFNIYKNMEGEVQAEE